nr:major capsid protein [Sphingobium indicum]
MSYQFPTRRLQSQDDAAMVARPDVPRSKFSGSFSVKTTFDAGKLIPFHVEEVYPGDHFRYRFTPFVRTATPLFPIMDSQRIDIHAFFCPNRLVYDDWVKLMGQQNAPGDSIAFSVPQCTSAGNGFAVGSLGDYLGLPTVGQPAAVLAVSLLPFRAYTRICYEWFRDENLVTYNAQALLKDGVNAGEAVFPIRNRAKSHDYFTSCLPWPQKFVAPQITSPVIGLGVQTGVATTAAAVTATETPSIATPTGVRVYANAYQSTGDQFIIDALGVNGVPQLFAQSDINLFRQAMAVQTFLERMARGGTRYTEITENIFGVRNPDARLQRPEYIGGGSTPLQFLSLIHI